MKKGIIFTTLFFCLALCQISKGQSTTFTYQGSLKNGGSNANGNFDFVFALFDAASGGTQIGSAITRTNVPVTDGVFSVALSFGNEFPGANRFLEIGVRQSGGGAFTTLTPRQQVTSAPYSIKSINADSLGGVVATQYILSGAPGINATTQFEIGGNRVLSVGGTNNTFAGVGAGTVNTGANNAFFGRQAGQANTSGTSNSFFGKGAGLSNTTASQNSFFGSDSGTANTTGTLNSFFGEGAGIANMTGGSNSFFGRRSGSLNTSGNTNSFFGIFSGDSNTSGDRNVFIGANAGHDNITGNFNTIIGADADVGASNLTNATAIGRFARVDANNSLILGSVQNVPAGAPATNVGIGTTAPINRLTIGQPETPVINASVGVFNSGSAFITTRDTTNNIEGLFGVDTNGVILGAMTNNEIQFRTGNVNRMRILTDGTVNIGGGTGDPTVTLGVHGLIAFSNLGSSGSVALCYNTTTDFLSTCSSSRRYKKDVNPFNQGLNLIRQLRPVSFKWKQDGMPDMGLVAEEVAEVEPLLTTTNDKGEIEGVKYDRVGVVLVNAVNEQQTQIESQQKQIDEQKGIIKRQEAEIKKQRAEFEALKKLVCSQNPTAEICQPKN